MAWDIKPDTADGILFMQDDKTSDRAPDVKGTLTLDAGLLNLLVAQHAAGGEIKMELAGWYRKTKFDKDMISLSGQMPRMRAPVDGARPAIPPRPVPRPAPAVVPLRKPLDDDAIPF